MEFDNNRPIYLQICDSIYERILSGDLKSEDRVLSVRELAAEIGVNPNTVSRAYEKMTEAGIIYTKRGLGYYISSTARETVLENERSSFMVNELPKFIKRINLLGIDMNSLLKTLK